MMMIKFFFPGLVLGFFLNLCLFRPASGAEIQPQWHGSIHAPHNIEKSVADPHKEISFFVKKDDTACILGSDGSLVAQAAAGNYLTSFSADGKYFIRFLKIGTEIEFYSFLPKLERFWKIKSLEYPYLSPQGKIIFLLNSDQSRIRMIDYNGNETGDRFLSGILCTVIAFSERSDFGAAGFMSGGYFFVNPAGKVICRGNIPKGSVVKGMAVSDSGLYGAVHYGSAEKDSMRIIKIEDNDIEEVMLDEVHRVKSPLHITDKGIATIVQSSSILQLTKRGKISHRVGINPRRPGLCFISSRGAIYTIGYTQIEGESRFVILKKGTVLYSKSFSAESFLSPVMKGELIFLRGSDNLFCYSLPQRSDE